MPSRKSMQDVRPLDDLLLHAVVQVVVHLLDELVVGQAVEVDVLVVVGHRGGSGGAEGWVPSCWGFHIVEPCRMMELRGPRI
jgi:hypothetical protein